MHQEQYALLTYKARPQYNVGDYIQSMAAAQFLPRVDKYINRDGLSFYKGSKIKLIMNGWFMHHPERWPPSESIDPLLISFHLNSQAKDKLLNEKGKAWFRKHGPVGCRDPYTLEILQKAGIDAFLSGCLTTTFQNAFLSRTNDIYFVDVLFRVPGWSTISRSPAGIVKAIVNGDIIKASQRTRIQKKLFDDDLMKNATELRHYQPPRHSEKERFLLAGSFLKKYATARLVITSRLHCALPCLAFGTPVIFIDSGFNREYDKCRLDGIKDLFNTVSINEEEEITSNFRLPLGKISGDIRLKNPETFRRHVDGLRQSCLSFINKVSLPV